MLLVVAAEQIDRLRSADVHDIDEARGSVGLADAIARFGEVDMRKSEAAVVRIGQYAGPSGIPERLQIVARKTAFGIIALRIGADDIGNDPVELRIEIRQTCDQIFLRHKHPSLFENEFQTADASCGLAPPR